METTTIFIHGLESSRLGAKAVFFKQRFPDMIIEDYRGNLDERMDTLHQLLSGKKDLIMVGSSFGGLMAAIYACQNPHKVKKLILLAPALNHAGFIPYATRTLDIPVTVYHGRLDDVVPAEPVRNILTAVFSNIQYHQVEDDHSLHQTFPLLDWDSLLSDP